MTFEEWLETQMDTAADPCEIFIAIEKVAEKLYYQRERTVTVEQFTITFTRECMKEGILLD